MNEPQDTALRGASGHLRRALALSTITVLVTLAWAGAAWAETFTVTNTNDSGAGSLREAIAEANANEGADEIAFADGVSGTITLGSELPVIEDSAGLVIDGGGDVTVSGNDAVAVFWVVAEAQLDVKNLTISDGAGFPISDVQGCCFRFGGGIYNHGTLTVTNSAISGNGPSFQESYGSGIYNTSSGTAEVTDSVLAGNEAVFGGAVLNRGTMEVRDSTFSGNHAEFLGGAILNGGALTVTNSTLSDNHTGSEEFSAGEGGGIYNGGTLTVSDSTFAGNHADVVGGGILNGGSTSNPGTVEVTNSTILGNAGGGFGNYGTLTVTNSTIVGNAGGGILNIPTASTPPPSTTLRNTILANSPGGGNCSGDPVSDGGYNVEDTDTCRFTEATGSLPNTDPLLDPDGLQDNGGPTQTIALQPDSPAVDLVADDACPPPQTDQRGIERPQGEACDSGAFELRQEPPQPPECTIKGTSGDDFLEGTSANDRICARGGNDVVVDHEGGNDTLLGHGGKDVLLDLKGKGLLKGGDGNDVLFALDDAPLDTMNGQSGSNDLCLGDNGDVRKNCERGSLLGLGGEQRERLDEAKDAAGL